MKKPVLISLDEQAWRAGFVSGNLCLDEACPYSAMSVEALSWSSGRIEGAAKPRGTLPQLRPLKNSVLQPIVLATVTCKDCQNAKGRGAVVFCQFFRQYRSKITARQCDEHQPKRRNPRRVLAASPLT